MKSWKSQRTPQSKKRKRSVKSGKNAFSRKYKRFANCCTNLNYRKRSETKRHFQGLSKDERDFRGTKGTFGGRKETKGGQRDNYDSCSFRSVIFACDTREGKGIACVTREVSSILFTPVLPALLLRNGSTGGHFHIRMEAWYRRAGIKGGL